MGDEAGIADQRMIFSKAELEKKNVATLLKGRWSKADLFLSEIDGKKLVLKDFSKKSFVIRFIGRIQIWREEKAYRALGEVDAIPRFYGRPDPWSLVIEYVDGVRLTHYRGMVPFKALIEELRRNIDSIHKAGVIHNDIRGRENIVVRKDDDKLMILDLAGAMIFKRGGLSYKLFFNVLRKVDDAAYLKWKNILSPEDMNDDEKQFLNRFNFLRRFWIFNLKGKR